ncbi:PREDICTED: tetraspanin-8-like isoform X2 [Nelumbo nucifera]|uniref:Tetraspanin-8-like isoform X2 n=2 Tax=Nelumbo nucifera TaxID=4432 RepID=A0A1U7Z976_NELNU|nr:PREDICTED: tetraspanin-8-like isoform X2 [Nelumbo nucifera]DAD17882.1 TPA_asm: hypothetical protein HUJ06_019345 [Nelumbo nucifera]
MLVSLARLIGEVLSGNGYKDYKLGDYSNWLQKRANNNKNWNKIKSCMMNSYVCNSISDATDTVEQFYSRHLSIQLGCCKPLTTCKFQYERPTIWNKTNTTSTLTDCASWDKPTGELCFNCFNRELITSRRCDHRNERRHRRSGFRSKMEVERGSSMNGAFGFFVEIWETIGQAFNLWTKGLFVSS